MRIVLASKSPRRQEILRTLGLDFEVMNTGTEVPGFAPEDEPRREGESVREYVLRTARDKALRAFASLGSGRALVIAADTVVEKDGVLYGKPADREEEIAFLKAFSGATHTVRTALFVGTSPEDGLLAEETARVTFRKLSSEEMRAYADSAEPYDKAGGYAIQGKAGAFVASMQGTPSNVIGLPAGLLADMLAHFGVDLWRR